jgi:hypothetical protein
MSDGREERQEREQRLEQEKRENRKDWIGHDAAEEWQPDKLDSPLDS